MADNKWTMFKNYMHNELGITKEDIQQWLRDAVAAEVKSLVAQEYGKFDIRDAIKDAIYSNASYWESNKTLTKEIRRDVCDAILKRFEISIDKKEITDDRIY